MAPAPDVGTTPAEDGRLGAADGTGLDHWTRVANENWLKRARSKKVKKDVVKSEIWDVLEKESFQSRSLLVLENLQILESYVRHNKVLTTRRLTTTSYLWPSFNEDSSNHHVILLAIFVHVKRRENLPIWRKYAASTTKIFGTDLAPEIFADRASDFSCLFRRILSTTLDTSLRIHLRAYLLSFIISAFQSLESGLVRKECAPLVSIAIWHNLASDAIRDHKLEKHGQLKKAWRAASKRYDAADEATKARLRFERSWLYSLVLDFLAMLYGDDESTDGKLQSISS